MDMKDAYNAFNAIVDEFEQLDKPFMKQFIRT